MAFPFLQPDQSKAINWVRVKEQIGYVPQELPHWYGALEDNLQYEAALHGIRGEDNLREVKFIVERLRLADHLGKRWSELSGGFKLRFSLAKALVWKPKLLLIDEPLANLDFKAQLVILQDLRDMADGLRYPMSVMISSQHLHEVEAVADNILFLKAGSVIFNGPITGLGTSRDHNTYELNCPVELAELGDCLAGLAKAVDFNGLSFVVTTPIGVDQRAILTRLLERNVQVDYFRDISRSVKQLFSSTELP
jgi:ABC-type multidrug transport system ATPase subunit